MYEDAIAKLKELAENNDDLCNKLEKGEINFGEIEDEIAHQRKVDSLIRSYRYWCRSCYIAAWLLEQSK